MSSSSSFIPARVNNVAYVNSTAISTSLFSFDSPRAKLPNNPRDVNLYRSEFFNLNAVSISPSVASLQNNHIIGNNRKLVTFVVDFIVIIYFINDKKSKTGNLGDDLATGTYKSILREAGFSENTLY